MTKHQKSATAGLSLGAGIAIAAIWLSCASLLIFVTKKAFGAFEVTTSDDVFTIVFAVLLLSVVVLVLAVWATALVAHRP
jgi:hypothetical protein